MTKPKTAKKRKFRIRGAARIGIGFSIIVGGAWLIWTYGIDAYVSHLNYSELTPGNVNIIGIKPGTGYRVVVRNQIATLVKGGSLSFSGSNDGPDESSTSNSSDNSLGGSTSDQSSDTSSGSGQYSLPIREMLGALTGNVDQLSGFIAGINGLAPDDSWPNRRIVWKAEDIQKALNGDPVLKKKLIDNLNVDFDGTPLAELNLIALENGIIVDTPCPVTVNIGGKPETLIARIQRPYLPSFLRDTLQDYDKHGDPTLDQRPVFYAQHLKLFASAKAVKENVRGALESLIDPQGVVAYGKNGEKLLDSAYIVLNDKEIKNASIDETKYDDKHTSYSLALDLTNEGRMRMWKYSIQHPHDQLLVVSGGVAIAAPYISHELFMSHDSITQMADKDLVQDAVDRINKDKSL